MPTTPLNVALIGAGGMARAHVRTMFAAEGTANVVAIVDPSAEAANVTAAMFTEHKLPVPRHYPDLDALFAAHNGALDAAVIITPHSLHLEQTKRCLVAGLDVLLEKPMVLNVAEAEDLIAARDASGKALVIAFQGSLSAQIRYAAALLKSGELGEMLSISGVVWQSWGRNTVGTWRQMPTISGGGFLFDTGAHMLNSIADLAGEDFAEVAAWLDQRGNPVEVMGVIMGRLKSGALVTIHGSGDTVGLGSEIRVFCSQGLIVTGQWGERLLVQKHGETEATPVELPATPNTWEQFLAVRAGDIPNPSPAEIGLRMIRLWDSVRESAARDGAVVRLA
jgi:predicted dehydrogenase